jgi:hypothetical protein
MSASPTERVPSGVERMPPTYCMIAGLRLYLVLVQGYRHRRLREATINVLNILSMPHQHDQRSRGRTDRPIWFGLREVLHLTKTRDYSDPPLPRSSNRDHESWRLHGGKSLTARYSSQ